MQKATDVFDEWAKNGKDIGMEEGHALSVDEMLNFCLLYTSPSPRDATLSRMPSSA